MPCSDLRFLVVEDQEFQRNVLSNLLNRLGARDVHQADDGHSALRVLRDPDRPLDIVASDPSMPGMDGIVLKAIASGVSTKEDWVLLHEWGCELGQGPFISAPLPPQALAQWLGRWTQSRPQ